ncbi:hypothetical protein CLAFUW4_08770 [Fulvia fulva]|uniref:Uncharacterized protein n=1 Tax=Passalora fulva TaxID=5499 RepID=A0A9Q8UTQ9_PASFU|nr:uncharacterized protein CLAFUR5_08870 [Fulvia fulva]KAK4614236.1 hypothetical protein CLAFUR4_08775 [Fulvia fulva]KAK4614269.1 hypothetical protein CLAFUR0_08770 [Fulvia fulva]UJO22179.1 hypothetical protein CLAFUR5_08870 [Fulvia fulva]WPV20622.1 hypothetical protein CLAFUW4_08770 [Fulvia fulva]WPV35487.1 hypothetical protein CLAFUW7_08770 [Fulvia fulva]
MARLPDYSPAVCLRLITDLAEGQDHHCTLCTFFHGREGHCQHGPATQPSIRTATPFTECSFYTARSDTSDSDFTLSARSSSSTIKARIQISTSDLKQHHLKRKTSPTEVSLRDLNLQQEHNLRIQQSEEQLQRVYEEQILSYLNANHGDLGTIYGLSE